METNKARVPQVGEKLHFFDDGKLQNNRHYIAECVKILTPEEAKNYKLSEVNTLYEYRENAYKVFKEFYKSSTDYFLGCTIPNYFDSIVWFVRNPDNDWTILDIQDDWIAGILDTDNELYKKGIELFGEDTLNKIHQHKVEPRSVSPRNIIKMK